MLLALLLAGLLEGVGLTMLLPLIGIAVGNPTGAGPLPAAKEGAAESTLEQMVTDGFAALGIRPTAMEAVLPDYLWRFRPSGQYDAIKESAKNLKA